VSNCHGEIVSPSGQHQRAQTETHPHPAVEGWGLPSSGGHLVWNCRKRRGNFRIVQALPIANLNAGYTKKRPHSPAGGWGRSLRASTAKCSAARDRQVNLYRRGHRASADPYSRLVSRSIRSHSSRACSEFHMVVHLRHCQIRTGVADGTDPFAFLDGVVAFASDDHAAVVELHHAGRGDNLAWVSVPPTLGAPAVNLASSATSKLSGEGEPEDDGAHELGHWWHGDWCSETRPERCAWRFVDAILPFAQCCTTCDLARPRQRPMASTPPRLIADPVMISRSA